MRTVTPWTGRTGGRHSSGRPAISPERLPAAMTTDVEARASPISSVTPDTRCSSSGRVPTSTHDPIGHIRHPGDPAGLNQGGDERPVVDLVVIGQVHASTDARGQHRLGLSAESGPEADGREADGLVETEHPVNGHAVGRIAGHKKRAVRPEVHGPTGRGLQLSSKAGPGGSSDQVERGQRLLAEVGLGDGGQHAGRRPCGALPRVGIDHSDIASRLGGAPGDR